MREILEAANRDLLHQINVLLRLLRQASVPGELAPYVQRVSELCGGLRQRAELNLLDLEDDLRETFIDILSDTQLLTQEFGLVNTRLALPIVRSQASDRLALRVLKWLHTAHSGTASFPFGFTDRGFAVYPPLDRFPPVYFLPVSRQQTLLYLPLLFHEFGHVLHACHEEQLRESVEGFLQLIAQSSAPLTVRGTRRAARDDSFRAKLLVCWYRWLREFFCDAVGVTIGGPAFVRAFSSYFRTRSDEEFFVPRRTLLRRDHPVAWLRTRMLADRARKLGLANVADDVRATWHTIAAAVGADRDYQGTWSDDFFVPLRETLGHMIKDAGTRVLTADEVTPPTGSHLENPVRLLNSAWARFDADPSTYAEWEREQICAFASTP